MYFEKRSSPQHDGTETYQVTFVIKEQDDLYDVRGAFVQFTIRPETVTLVWERWMQHGVRSEWRRVGYRPRGAFSAVKGPRVLKDGDASDKQEGIVEVFASPGKLTKYAASLPHLEQMIEQLEKSLPQ